MMNSANLIGRSRGFLLILFVWQCSKLILLLTGIVGGLIGLFSIISVPVSLIVLGALVSLRSPSLERRFRWMVSHG